MFQEALIQRKEENTNNSNNLLNLTLYNIQHKQQQIKIIIIKNSCKNEEENNYNINYILNLTSFIIESRILASCVSLVAKMLFERLIRLTQYNQDQNDNTNYNSYNTDMNTKYKNISLFDDLYKTNSTNNKYCNHVI